MKEERVFVLSPEELVELAGDALALRHRLHGGSYTATIETTGNNEKSMLKGCKITCYEGSEGVTDNG